MNDNWRLFLPAIGRAAAFLSVTLVLGCAARYQIPEPDRTAALRRQTDIDLGASERAILRTYRGARGCDGAAYSRARTYATAKLDVLAGAPTETGHISDVLDNGRFRVRLAEVAAQKGCADLARRNYDEVIAVFTGEPYSALRRRAMNGLAHLRKRSSPEHARSRDNLSSPLAHRRAG